MPIPGPAAVFFIALWRSDGVTGMFFCLLYACVALPCVLAHICGCPGGTGGRVDWIGILDKEMGTTPLAPFSIALYSINRR